jgi:uncharacterized protein YndB with AHSA1/START domain
VGGRTKEIWIDAPPEKVYGYLVEPELTVRWFGDESWSGRNARLIREVEDDPRGRASDCSTP